jgi:hypothetical protein
LNVSCSSDEPNFNSEQVTPEYKIEFSGEASTILDDYTFGIKFIADGITYRFKTWSGNTTQNIYESKELTGATIGIELGIAEFLPETSNNPMGISLNSINVKITKISDNTILVDENLEPLFANTDSRYYATLQYEVSEDAVNITYETDGF